MFVSSKVSALVAVLITLSANVRASTVVSSIRMSTHPTGADCASLVENSVDDSNHCNGGLDRVFTTANNDKHNIIPQQDAIQKTILKYEGTLPAGNFISLVDTERSMTGNPCVPEEAGHVADNLHSGPLLGTLDGEPASAAGKVVKLDQTANLLTATKTYAVCYATGNGNTTDATWTQAGITIQISRLSRVDIYGVQFRSCGMTAPCSIPSHPDLTLRYYGTIDTDRWMSLVDSTLNGGKPCASGSVAAAFPDTSHTGSKLATAELFKMDTAVLSTATKTLCYSESGGLVGSHWMDSGLRFQRSTITSVEYGVDTSYSGSGGSYSAWNRYHDHNIHAPTDRLPRTPGLTKVSYSGDATTPTNLFVSLVSATLGNNQPCHYPQTATASPDGNHSGVFQASGSVLSFVGLSNLTLLDGSNNLKVYAVCFSADNIAWGDSYVRYSMSQLESMKHHNAVHVTSGMIPQTSSIEFVIGGELPVDSQIVIVKEGDNSHLVTVNETTFYDPCRASNAVLGSGTSSATYRESSNVTLDASNQKRVTFDTSDVDTGTYVVANGETTFARMDALYANANNREYTGSAVNTLLARGRFIHNFAVCYKESGSADFHDSGIRLTVSKMTHISHGKAASGYTPYLMYPGSAGIELPSTGQATARQVIPVSPSIQVEYFSPDLGNDRYFSIVDASLNTNKPCVGNMPWDRTVDAAVSGDTTHSGSLTAQTGTSKVIIPQTTLLMHTKTYAVCYAVTSGTSADESWHDSYIRLRVSLVESITSLGVVHQVNTKISSIASRTNTSTYNPQYYAVTTPSLLPVTYQGPFGAVYSPNYLSLVDDTLNANFPCTSDSAAGSGLKNSGGANGADSSSTVLLHTALLNTSKIYAVCYSNQESSSYTDSGIRVKRSVVTSIQYKSGYAYPAAREMTSVNYDTNRLPTLDAAGWAGDIELGYVGSVVSTGANVWLSFVKFKSSGSLVEDPCHDNSWVAEAPDGDHSGPLLVNASVSGFSAIAPITTALGMNEDSIAVCYSLINGTAADQSWSDSYVRLKYSKVAALELSVGKYTDATYTPGKVVRHRTAGHLPNIDAYDVTWTGALASGSTLAFVALDASTSVVTNGATYQRPCGNATHVQKPQVDAPTTTTGPLTAPSGSSTVSINSLLLNTSLIFALCYLDSNIAHDSGIRFTVSKIKNLKFHTTDSPDRDNTPQFLSTNRLPQWMTRQLQYQGSADLLGKYISIVEDSLGASPTSGGYAGTGNPCASSSVAAAGVSTLTSGPLQLKSRRSCSRFNEHKTKIASPMTVAAPYASTSDANVNVNTWELCLAGCENDVSCAAAVWDKVNMTCQHAALGGLQASHVTGTGFAEHTGAYDTQWGRGKFISAICDSTPAQDTAVIPQHDSNGTAVFLSAGATQGNNYAVCYSEFGGGSSDIWLDTHIRFRMSGLGALETSGTLHFTTGHVPIIGVPIHYDYLDSNREHQFTWRGEESNNTRIMLINQDLNQQYPCVASQWNAVASGDKTLESTTRGVNDVHHLLDTRGLDTSKVFAVCTMTVTGGVLFDSGLRVTVSKIAAVTYSSGHVGAPGVEHDATDARIMTTKPALTNTFPVKPNEMLTIVPSDNNPSGPSTFYVSLVLHTKNNGKPCESPAEVLSAADNEHSGPVLATLAGEVTIPQSTLLEAHREFRVCYGVNGTSAATADWKDSYITLRMTKVFSLNVHTPVNTGLRAAAADSIDSVMKIRTVGQLPSQRANQTTRYSVDTSYAVNLYISLVDAMDNVQVDNAPVSINSGYSRPDPCRATTKVQMSSAPTNYSAWVSELGVADATHGEISSGFMSNMDTTLVNSSKLFAVCYSSFENAFYDSGIRVTISQVTGIFYSDIQGRVDRTREITSVTKTYNVLPLSNQVVFTNTGEFSGKWFSLVAHDLNNQNPCVRHDYADPSSVLSGAANWSTTYPAQTTDKMYALCYATEPGNRELDTGADISRWIRSRGAGPGVSKGATWRDSFIRVFATEIEKVTSYGIDFNIRGQIPGHRALAMSYAGGLNAAGVRIALVSEHLNSQTVGATNYSFPCSDEFGSNAFGPTVDPWASGGACKGSATSNCLHSGVQTSAGSHITLDTTDLDTQQVYAVCYNRHETNNATKWRDSGIRLTVPEIQMITMSSGQAGTPKRVYKSWDTTNDATVLDRPTSRLPAVANISLGYVSAPTASASRTGDGTKFSIVRIYSASAVPNPCTQITAGVYAAAAGPQCLGPNMCTSTGEISASGGAFTVPQGPNELLLRNDSDPESATYTVCYRSISSNSGAIEANMHSAPNSHTQTSSFTANTVFWEDSYIRLKISGVSSITAAGVTHFTTGQIPNTAAESLETWSLLTGKQSAYPFEFTYASDPNSLAGDRYISLVDATLNQQANGEGLPCASTNSTGTMAIVEGDTEINKATNFRVTGWNTMLLNSSKVYALCYDGTNLAGSGTAGMHAWSDSGIRLTVPDVHAIYIDSASDGPQDKEDTRARPMTATVLATNTVPRDMHSVAPKVRYAGTLPHGSSLSLVAVDESATKNPCLIPNSHDISPTNGASNVGVRTKPAAAGPTDKEVTFQVNANELLDSTKLYAVCYDVVAASANAHTPQFTHSPECDCHLKTNAQEASTCKNSCDSSKATFAGGQQSFTWRDSFVRVRVTEMHALKVHHSVTTDSSSRRTITIQTAGGIPATNSIKQIGFEYVGTMLADPANAKGYLRLAEDTHHLAAADDTGIQHYQPCVAGANLHNATSNSNFNTKQKSQSASSQIITNFETDGLNTTKRFAVCYTLLDGTTANEWQDSGLRVTVSKLQSLHYLGDVPYSSSMLSTELPLLTLRNRELTSTKTALNRLPRSTGVRLRWDGPDSDWPNERNGSHVSEHLALGKYVSIVSTSLNGGNPCVNPVVASAAPGSAGSADARLHSGVMTGTDYFNTTSGSWVYVPNQAGNMLARSTTSEEYAVCYAEGDGSATDITWRDSFIRFETTEIGSITQTLDSNDGQRSSFLHNYKTTGQLASFNSIRIEYHGSLGSGAQLSLVHSVNNSRREEAGSDEFSFPCGLVASASATGNLSSGPITASGSYVDVNTADLHASSGGNEVIYAVCYKRPGASFWEDSAIRVSLSQVYEILRESGYNRGNSNNTLPAGSVAGNVLHDHVYGIDTNEPTKANHIDPTWKDTNRLPADAATVFTYVTRPNSLISGTAGNNKNFSFVHELLAESWASPCDMAGIVSTSNTQGSGILASHSSNSKVITFNSSLLLGSPQDGRFAVCYNHDGAPGSWRDAYIRVEFSEVMDMTALQVKTRTIGQLPSAYASEGMEVTYSGRLGAGKWLSLVDSTLNANRPCAPGTATAAASSGHSGVHQAPAYAKAITTFQTVDLDRQKLYAVCYSSVDGTSMDSSWSNSGILLSVSKLDGLTLPFDGSWSDPCRSSGHTCTTSDRLMTSYPRPTNRIARADGQQLKLSSTTLTSPYLALVDASINNNNPCVDPSIPGSANYLNHDGTGNTTDYSRQKTTATQAVMGVVTIPQPSGSLIKGPVQVGDTYGALGKVYTVCYAENSGSDTDLSWRDSFIRLTPSDILSFGTKNVAHRTYGVIPHHDSGLEYVYSLTPGVWMDSGATGNHFITLVEATTTDEFWEEAAGRPATVVAGSIRVSFTGSAVPVSVGSRVKIGNEVRWVHNIVDSTTFDVSVPFTQTTSSGATWWYQRDWRFSGEGFVNKIYDPCTREQGSDSLFNTTLTYSLERAAPSGEAQNVYKWRSVNTLKTTGMKAKTPYALCFSSNVAATDNTKNDWFDSGLRVEVPQVSAIEYSGLKRGVVGFPTAYNLGYGILGSGDCTGTTITSYYYYDYQYTDAQCAAKCDSYSDCLGYQASSVPVPSFGGRDRHCKIWKAADKLSTISGIGSAWGNSRCMFKTYGNDQITRGKNHRKIQSVELELQPSSEIAAPVLPMSNHLDLVYAGTLPASKHIAIVALSAVGAPDVNTTGANPCGDAFNAATASATSTGAMKACESTGPGYTAAYGVGTGGNYILPGGMCKPSGVVCEDQIGTIMATLHATGCPNTNRNHVASYIMNQFEVSTGAALFSQMNTVCSNAAGGINDPNDWGACCGRDADGVPLTCTPTCVLQTETSDCSYAVSTQGNKEISFSLGTTLNLNAAEGYTICYTDGDGSSTDPKWRDSFVRVKLSKVTAIIATGVTHTDHGHLASHDSVAPLEVEYAGASASDGYTISFIDETLNSNNPCGNTSFADGSDSTISADAKSVSNTASSKKVEIQTSHLGTNLTFAVCYKDATWYDSGIRVRITEVTNVRYNEAQVGGNTSGYTGQYTRDMTSSRVRIAPPSGDDYFTGDSDGYAQLAPYEDVRSTTATHTIPASSIRTLDLSYRGSAMTSAHVALVEENMNFGDPCVLGTVVAAGAASLRTSVKQATSGSWNFSPAEIMGLDPTKKYTLCYDPRQSSGGTASNPYAQNALTGGSGYRVDGLGIGNWDQGLGVPVQGWRDSFIRFSISRISAVSSHGTTAMTQGTIARTELYTLSFLGTVSIGEHISLTEESVNSYYPCLGDPPTGPSNVTSGAIAAGSWKAGLIPGNVSIDVDTTNLAERKNFAVCYQYRSVWYDSGIRVWVSSLKNLYYNTEQAAPVVSDEYHRYMRSTNHESQGAQDHNPPATNRLPLTGSSNSPFELVPGWAGGGGAQLNVQISFVDTNSAVPEPCASAYDASQASDTTHLLPPPAQSGTITVNTSGTTLQAAETHTESHQIAVCYFDDSAVWRGPSGNTWPGQWRDSLIRLKPSKLWSIESYGIVHKTTGMVANKGSLYVGTAGAIEHTAMLSLVEAETNGKQPCVAQHAAGVMSIHQSGPSSHNMQNSHNLNTSLFVNATTVYAVCYIEPTPGGTEVWKDSGIRVSTPAMISMKYSAPARTYTSASCFSSNLFGLADCNADTAHNCTGPSCTGGDPSATCSSSDGSSQSCPVIARDNSPDGTGIEYQISTPGVTYVSFVEHRRGAQANNPCRDAAEAAGLATKVPNPDAREHSGPLLVDSSGVFKLPQLSDQSTYSNFLAENATFALCYTQGSGTTVDGGWRDSYVRVTMSKIAAIQASDMVVTTHGTLANVPSLRVSWRGSLGFKKWINLIETSASGATCNKGTAETLQQCAESCAFGTSSAFVTTAEASAGACKLKCQNTGLCKAWTFSSGNCYAYTAAAAASSTQTHGAIATSGVLEEAFTFSGWIQADSAEEFVDMDTTSLTANKLYTVCYADVVGTPSTGAPPAQAVWKDSSLRLRFVKWTNPEKQRIASGAASLMTFTINHGGFDSSDYFALIKGATDCSSAPAAPLLSNGTMFRKHAVMDVTPSSQTNTGTWGFAMPSGTHATEQRATGWRTCRPVLLGPTRLDLTSYETCNQPGLYGDLNLEEGNYAMCFCDSDHGNSGCDQANEWIRISGSGVTSGSLSVVQTPRIGRADVGFSSASHVGSVRGISLKSHTYNIKTTGTAGLEISNGDQIYFKPDQCDSIPTTNAATETAPISVTGFDSTPASATFNAARVVTPSTLESNGAIPRPLVSCFATQESLAQPLRRIGNITGTCTGTCTCLAAGSITCDGGSGSCTGYQCIGGFHARDYVMLEDGLEIAAKPRLGSNAYGSPHSVIRSLSGSSPSFDAFSLRPGDKLWFKEMSTHNSSLTGQLSAGLNICDYQNGESCSCDAGGAAVCSNAAHMCTGFTCTLFPEGVDTDCTDGVINVDGSITHSLLSANQPGGTKRFDGSVFYDVGVAGQTVTHVVTITNYGNYAVDAVSQAELAGAVGNTYVFNLDSSTLNAHPLILSLTEGGMHNAAETLTTGVVFTLDGTARSLDDYLAYFAIATTRSITYTPTAATRLWYLSANNDDEDQLISSAPQSNPHSNLQNWRRDEMGGSMVIHKDDSGVFQLPTDVPLTAIDATTPRFLSACFIPAGALETLHAPLVPNTNNCSYHAPHDSSCTKSLVNAHRLEDYLQVIPEPTQNLKLEHNHSEVYSLMFNKPSYGTFWRASNHWCQPGGDTYNWPCGVRQTDRGLTGTPALCCQSPPNFASGSPGDIVVLKREGSLGSGDCVGVEDITDGDYFIGSQHSRKMTLSTIDDDRSTQTSPIRANIMNGQLRAVSEKGAHASHYTIADGKVNELPEGFYTVCYATAESGGDHNNDFVKLSKSITILPKTYSGPSLTVPRAVLNGHNINVKWSATNGLHPHASEALSWIGLFKVGECPNGSGEFQNRCHLASQTLNDGISGDGTISFSPADYKLTTGPYEVRYFEGTSRDKQGMVCKGAPNNQRDTYMYCILESNFNSSPIMVYSGIEKMDDETNLPGLEFVFRGHKSRHVNRNGDGGRFAFDGAENVAAN